MLHQITYLDGVIIMVNVNLIRERLRAAREMQCMTLKQVAARLSTDTSLIHHWETGYRLPSMHSLYKLCIIYEVSPNYLMGWDKEDESQGKMQVLQS